MHTIEHRPVTGAGSSVEEVARLGTKEAARQQALLRVGSPAVSPNVADTLGSERRRADRRTAPIV